MNNFHKSVLLNEVIDYLCVQKGEKYIDATLGGGGHSQKILELGGKVLGIDQDQDSIDFVTKKLKSQIIDGNLILTKGNFRNLDEIANVFSFKKVKGIIFDLGVSSYQINTPDRGFSFLRNGPLDMRMDKASPVTAEALVNLLQKGELNDIFNKFGQEHRFRSVSEGIISARRVKAIKTTDDLAEIIKNAYNIKGEITDFTKNKISQKVFQALRIAVNDEMTTLEEALPKTIGLMEKGGRIEVISFHSLEDRIVKNMFNKFEKEGLGKMITKKPIIPKETETADNKRAKSAKLRVFEVN